MYRSSGFIYPDIFPFSIGPDVSAGYVSVSFLINCPMIRGGLKS